MNLKNLDKTIPNCKVSVYGQHFTTLKPEDVSQKSPNSNFRSYYDKQSQQWKKFLGPVDMAIGEQELGECIPLPIWKFLAPPNRKSIGQSESLMIFCIQTMM